MTTFAKRTSAWLLFGTLTTLAGCATKPLPTLPLPVPLPEPSLNTLEPASAILTDWKTMQTRWQTERCKRLRILKPSLPPCKPDANPSTPTVQP